MQVTIQTPRWVCQGSIPIETASVGVRVPFYDSMYFSLDIAETDPEYRLYLLGYGVRNTKIEKTTFKPKCSAFLEKLQKKLTGRCYCCLRASYPSIQICPECNSMFPFCSIKLL